MQEIAKSGRSRSPTPATDTATEEEEEDIRSFLFFSSEALCMLWTHKKTALFKFIYHLFIFEYVHDFTHPQNMGRICL